MRFSSILFFLPLVVAAQAQVTVPPDAKEGFAVHLVDESGNITYVHETEFANYGITLSRKETSSNATIIPSNATIVPSNATIVSSNATIVSSNATNVSSLLRRKLPAGDKITCENWKGFQIMDFRTNLVELMDYLACGYNVITSSTSKYKYVAMSNYYRSNVIYICNYSNQYREFDAAALLSFTEKVFNECGQRASAGWYTEAYYNVAWGYTSSNQAFCGPPQ